MQTRFKCSVVHCVSKNVQNKIKIPIIIIIIIIIITTTILKQIKFFKFEKSVEFEFYVELQLPVQRAY